jgi:DNA-binding response OmpR family regulator
MRILVIEDDNQLAAFLEHGLKEEGFAVDIAGTGEEGEELTDAFEYDLLVVDVMLPLMNGLDVCRDLRQRKLPTPILITSGKRSVEDRIRGLDAGADDYITKPFIFGELMARIRALLRREHSIIQPKLSAGLIIMDTMNREVMIGENKVDLTKREFAILEYLLRHQNKVVTRTSLEQHVWDQEFDSGSNMVDVYIRRLRQKIGDDDARLIETLRGAGYRLVNDRQVL